MRLRSMAAAMFVAVVGLSATLAFSEDGREAGAGNLVSRFAGPTGVRVVENAQYANECGSCHFAYQPGLLPEASWQKIMVQLADHFGENAELDADTQAQLTEYLVANAAERDDGRIARSILRSVSSQKEPVLRITETRYFKHEHDELPPRVWRDNPEVGSLSQCSACHTQADKASFDEHQVRIPGVGRWED